MHSDSDLPEYFDQIDDRHFFPGGYQMLKRHVVGLLAAPAVAAAILGGAGLALAGTANADFSDYSASNFSDYSPSNFPDRSANMGGGWGYPDGVGDIAGAPLFARPTTFADPAPEVVPWAAWINQG